MRLTWVGVIPWGSVTPRLLMPAVVDSASALGQDDVDGPAARFVGHFAVMEAAGTPPMRERIGGGPQVDRNAAEVGDLGMHLASVRLSAGPDLVRRGRTQQAICRKVRELARAADSAVAVPVKPPTWPDYAWHAPLLVADLLPFAPATVGTYLETTFARYAREAREELP